MSNNQKQAITPSFQRFLDSIENPNTKKVAKSYKIIGYYDYSNCTIEYIEQIILDMKPNSPRGITTICHTFRRYAKFLENEQLQRILRDIDRNELWMLARPNASTKYISHSEFNNVYHQIQEDEKYNILYVQTLFRCIYEGIYSNDLSVIKNLRASDIIENKITLHEDKGKSYEIEVSPKLANDLIKLSNLYVWERDNLNGTCEIDIEGLYHDSCFKIEIRKSDAKCPYRYTYHRILRGISQSYFFAKLKPQQLFISGIMFRIGLNLQRHGISLEEAFAAQNRNRVIGKIISDELRRCNNKTLVNNFREIVKGHIDVFISDFARNTSFSSTLAWI